MVRISFGVINQAVRIIFWLKHKYSLIKNGPGAVAGLFKGSTFRGGGQISSGSCTSKFTPCQLFKMHILPKTVQV